MRFVILFPLSLLLLGFAAPLAATTYIVPTQIATIQEAINQAQDGDTVLVEHGTYYENINFRGKKIVVAGRFLLTGDPNDILATVINGSRPVHPDTASCVIFGSHEDTSSVLCGFTLTGGTGTVWQDIHNLNHYREGGGVLSDVASPTIKFNFITGNVATNKTGVTSCGGGGIRCGDGNPRILNNVITNNAGRYGGGIVLNYSGAIIRNNVIYKNTGGEDFAGSGLWSYANGPAAKIVENNTILQNSSVLDGGGVYISTTSMILRNNIIWGNTGGSAPQIYNDAGGTTVAYCDVQGGWAGTGNISAKPQFMDSSAYLDAGSPCIDAGDLNAQYNDRENPMQPGTALAPSRGTLRNDMGAYGGPGSFPPVFFSLHLLAPATPSGVSAYSDYQTPGSVLLRWRDPDTTASGAHLINFKIRIYRGTVFLADVDSGVQVFQDTGLNLHEQYHYYFRTLANDDSSQADSATAFAGGSASPAPPSAFSVTDLADGIRLQWQNPSRQSDNTPLNDLAAIYIYRDGMLFDSIAQTTSDTGQARAIVDSVPGMHAYRLRSADSENPLHVSTPTDSLLGCGSFRREFFEGFEAGTGLVYRTGLWDTTSALAREGAFSITDSPSGNSTPKTSSCILMPNIIVPAHGIFSYTDIATVRNGIAFVEISTDHRKTFSTLKAYDGTLHTEWHDWSADPGDWFTERFDLSRYAGDTITIRFRLWTTGTLTADGWYIDSIAITQPPQATTSLDLAANWNMLSIPIELEQYIPPAEIFPHALSNPYKYNGAYLASDSIVGGTGYWLKIDSARQVPLTGFSVKADTISLRAGWNMIGSISDTVDSASVKTSPTGILQSSFLGYNGGYYASRVVAPGRAYWVRASRKGTMILSSH